MDPSIIVSQPPNDANVSITLAKCGMFAKRTEIANAIENYLIQGPEWGGYLLENHVAGQRSIHRGRDLGFGQSLRHVDLQHFDLGFFLVSQILAARRLVLLDAVLALLEHLFDHRNDRNIIKLDLFIDLFLLHRRHQQADRAEPIDFLGLHGRLHIVLDTRFETHDTPFSRQLERPKGRTEAAFGYTGTGS